MVRSRWFAVLGWLCIGMASPSCGGDDQEHSSQDAGVGVDAGKHTVDLAQLLREQAERDPGYCSRWLERVCAMRSPPTCTLDEALGTACERKPTLSLPLNTCGGATLWSQGPFGGYRWFYDAEGKLIGGHLYSDTNEYCGEFHIELGVTCESTQEKVTPCSR